MNSSGNAESDIGVAGVIEAPPPYCLVDPSKIRNTDHLPRYPHITPVEIVDLNTTHNLGNDQVKFFFFSLELYFIS